MFIGNEIECWNRKRPTEGRKEAKPELTMQPKQLSEPLRNKLLISTVLNQETKSDLVDPKRINA